jgi:AGCS family alanine or glycine:cation symporter
MIDNLFTYLFMLEDSLWGYFCFPAVILLGIYFCYKSRFVQIRQFPAVVNTFLKLLMKPSKDHTGVPPIRAFFACISGCVGIGNVVAICTAVQIGGPGALLWIWITAIVGMVLKYSEVYLGMIYRVPNNRGGYNGGPMYYLQRVFKGMWIPKLYCVFLCIYGVEVYQFSVMTESLSTNFSLNPYMVVAFLLGLVLYACSGGVNRVGHIGSILIPIFICIYLSMGLWVLVNNLTVLPGLFADVFASAFTGHAALGAFVGSTLLLTISQGIRRGCYTSDVGIGYASIIHSESSNTIPQKQASLVIFDIFLDAFTICTTSIMLILVTGVWKEPLQASMLVQTALGEYFPYVHVFMPLFLFLLGYSTTNAYFCVGLKSADFLMPKYGRKIFFVMAPAALAIFAFAGTEKAMTIMSLAQAGLLLINVTGMFYLRKDISFDIEGAEKEEEAKQPVVA